MALTDMPAVRRAGSANTRSFAGEIVHFFNRKSGDAEGATTRETLRQKDREGYDILESGAESFAPTDGVTC